MLAHLSGPTDIAGFRAEAGQLLAHQVPPGDVQWQTHALPCARHADLPSLTARDPGAARAASAIVPPSFQRLCELVVQHRDPARFDLLYRVLWRLVHEPALRADPLDADIAQAQHMAHAVRRDIHKTKTHLRFRTVQAGGQPLQIAWCEPVHHILDTVALWQLKREPQARWALLSPGHCVYADGSGLYFAAGLPAPPPEGDDAAWAAAWQQAFGSE